MIYVDNMNAKFGRMIMCHLLSDESVEELLSFADKLGMKREWFQSKASFPHYDVSLSIKKKAVELGAKEINIREVLGVMKSFREKQSVIQTGIIK